MDQFPVFAKIVAKAFQDIVKEQAFIVRAQQGKKQRVYNVQVGV